MLTLRLLGGLSLDNPARLPLGRASQRRRLALLAVLASQPGNAVSRDKILGLIWPEVPAEDGRRRLSVALYDLRQALGEESLLVTTQDATLLPGRLAVDVVEFETAVAGQDWERAIAGYAGPFLDGVYLVDAAGFEQWVDTRRAALERAFARALESAAHARAQRGDHPGALELWHRLSQLDPYSGAFAVGLMCALERAGDRGSAIRHAHSHAELLRGELGAEPDAEVERLAEELKGSPAQRDAAGPGFPPQLSSSSLEVAYRAQGAVAVHSARPWHTVRRSTALALFGLGLIITVASLSIYSSRAQSEPGRAEARSSGTASNEAQRAFAAGEDHLRAGQFDAAVAAFSSAVSADSMFALAYYRLAVATLWADRPGSVLDIPLARAQQLRDRLNLVDGVLLEAFTEWRRGDANVAEALYRRALTIDSTSVEAWHQLGETLFHYNPVRGRSIREAQAPFEKAIALDPQHYGSLWHLVQLAALERRTSEVDALAKRLLGLRPDAIKAREVGLFRAAALHDQPVLESLLETLRHGDESLLFGTGWRLAVFAHDLEAAARVFALLTDGERSRQIRRLGFTQLLYLELARGRPSAARKWLSELTALRMPDWPDPWTVVLAWAPPTSALDAARVRAVRDSLVREAVVGADADDLQVENFIEHRGAAAWAAFMLHDSSAGSLVDELQTFAQSAWLRGRALRTFADARAASGRGLQAWFAEQPQAALDWLDRSLFAQWFGEAAYNLVAAHSLDRFIRAEALFALRRYDEAEGWFAGLSEHAPADLVFLAPSLLRRAQIAEQRGDSASVQRFRAELADLWKAAECHSGPSCALYSVGRKLR